MRNLHILILLCFSCASESVETDCAVSTIVKFHSAELHSSLQDAQQYIDVNQVYSRVSNENNPMEVWTASVDLKKKLEKMDGKFTGGVLYHQFLIEERIFGSTAEVAFKDPQDLKVKKKYVLEKRRGKWIIIDILD